MRIRLGSVSVRNVVANISVARILTWSRVPLSKPLTDLCLP
jgi:hypothetical protein